MKQKFVIPGIPLACGVGLALSFPTFHWFPLAWVILIPVFVLARRVPPRQAGLIFLLTGWAYYTILLQWLVSNIFWAGGWAVLGMQGLCLLLSAFWFATGMIWRRSANHLPAPLVPLCLAGLWAGMEWIQSWAFTGFGWGALGYSQGPNRFFAQWASLGGVTLLSFFLVLVNGLLAESWAEKRWRRVLLPAAAGVAALLHAVGGLMLGTVESRETPLRVGIYQSNYPQQMKWDWEYTEDMVYRAAEHSRALIRDEPVDLFVWPEALVMGDYREPRLLDLLVRFTQETGADLFTGSVRRDAQLHESYNSSVLIDKSGAERDYYDKVHLAPFGEYLPFDDLLPFLRAVVPGDVDFGSEQKVLRGDTYAIGPLICFEVLFPPMAVWLRNEGADMLAIVTNLGWFGSSNGPSQEWEIARFRAIETRLPVIHSANTGVSGVIDPWGGYAIVDRLPLTGGRLAVAHPDWNAPNRVIQQRRLGVFDVPRAAPHPWPSGPIVMPWLLGLAGLLLAAFGWAGQRASAGAVVGGRETDL